MGNAKEWAIENVKVTPTVKTKLESFKIHPREPFSDVIARLIDFYEKQPLTTDKK